MKKIIISILITLSLITGGFVYYTSGYYRASEEAMQVVGIRDNVKVEQSEKYVKFIPQEIKAGFIFYPGGLVETISYAPLMKECAKQGILCILVDMPFHLAVLDMNAADGIIEQYNIEDWYIGGHSLGGSMAASYLSNHVDDYKGLILLASYSTEDLRGTDLSVLSIYGSEDGVLSRDKYEESKNNLPDNYIEKVIQGGNHAYFGNYGEQKGDGKATITPYEQVQYTVKYMVDTMFIN